MAFPHYSAQLGGIIRVPFVRGVAEFTRLRVDRPAEDLTLQFQTIPSRFEHTTSVRFSVVSPPDSTPREKVGFILEGNLGALPDSKDEILNAIRLGLSEKLDVDISRIASLDFIVSNWKHTGSNLEIYLCVQVATSSNSIVLQITSRGLAVSFDLLDRQPTDPPDVDSIEPALSQLQELINNHELLVWP